MLLGVLLSAIQFYSNSLHILRNLTLCDFCFVDCSLRVYGSSCSRMGFRNSDVNIDIQFPATVSTETLDFQVNVKIHENVDNEKKNQTWASFAMNF